MQQIRKTVDLWDKTADFNVSVGLVTKQSQGHVIVLEETEEASENLKEKSKTFECPT